MRSVSILEVADESVWTDFAAVDIDAHTETVLSPTRRIVKPSFEKVVLPELGSLVLVRYARRDAAQVEAARADIERQISALATPTRSVLHTAQRHALDGEVLGMHAWDPVHDAPHIQALLATGLLHPLPHDGPRFFGRFHLHPDLPEPPDINFDFSEATMPETEDLSEGANGPVSLLHDLAALAAALHHVPARRTHKGTLAKADCRKLGRRLGSDLIQQSGELDDRWSRALRGLEALGAIRMDPIQRILEPDLGLEDTLAGDTVDAVDRLVHKLVDRDLHVVVPAIRAALQQAGDGAVDEMIFVEILQEEHRELLFPRWVRDGAPVYPSANEAHVPYDEERFELIEVPMIERVLRRCTQIGLLRQAEGVFAGTADGRRWAGAPTPPRAPVWVSSDLEVMVPPHAITPWERFQLERLGRCLTRDVVDRYRLERAGLVRWLATHDLEQALDLLRRRCPQLPTTAVETLTEWARSATRIVLTRGVLLTE